MSVVVDSSVIVAALIDTGPDGVWAEEVIDDQVLYAPELVRVEATNVLRRLERAERITTADANGAQEDLTQLEIELFPFEPFSDRIWKLRHTVTSYDAWYVAVAEGLGYPLATLDGRLARTVGPKCKFLTPDSR
ncbi:MAG TPA: type II toxin-antitoxin system VapC family toxin [Steroidobacteraceae bacterium]|nr:type II toxin-antitoxin system VapC family toxin [Steroidobacteraceae bacterium]